jgi:hypothetical protein
MFLFYVDESGNRDTTHLEIRNPNGAVTPSWLYVLTAVSLFERTGTDSKRQSIGAKRTSFVGSAVKRPSALNLPTAKSSPTGFEIQRNAPNEHFSPI